MLNFINEDTICALATPHGMGGIAVVRLSGPKSLDYIQQLCPTLKKSLDSHRVYFTHVVNSESHEVIDEVLITYFAKGSSYTDEEIIEISSHGSPLVVQEILNQLVSLGCRMAEKGEFTYRAFMNQKLDLTQAESVASLIHSKSKRASRLALQQLKGDLSNEVQIIEERLTYVLANLEASIDFSTEDIDVMDYESNHNFLSDIKRACTKILSSYKSGRQISEGYQIAIIGRPNAGKSSLLNAILSENKAIVSEEPGTTRDVVEASFNVNGYYIKLLDTAGIHDTDNQVEKMGISKSMDAIQNADHIFYLLDPKEKSLDPDLANLLEGKAFDIWYSKSDLGVEGNLEITGRKFHSQSKDGVQPILDRISALVNEIDKSEEAVVFQARHYELFTRVLERVEKALEMIKNNASQEFIVLELQEALQATFEISGKKFDDDVMDRVFKEFCIGK